MPINFTVRITIETLDGSCIKTITGEARTQREMRDVHEYVHHNLLLTGRDGIDKTLFGICGTLRHPAMTTRRGHGAKYTRRRELAIAALLSEPTIAQAAARARIAERTLRGWIADDEFADLYADARRQVFSHAVARLQAGTGRAIDRLLPLVEESSPVIECRASLGLLLSALRAAELIDLDERLRQLEEILKAGEAKR